MKNRSRAARYVRSSGEPSPRCPRIPTRLPAGVSPGLPSRRIPTALDDRRVIVPGGWHHRLFKPAIRILYRSAWCGHVLTIAVGDQPDARRSARAETGPVPEQTLLTWQKRRMRRAGSFRIVLAFPSIHSIPRCDQTVIHTEPTVTSAPAREVREVSCRIGMAASVFCWWHQRMKSHYGLFIEYGGAPPEFQRLSLERGLRIPASPRREASLYTYPRLRPGVFFYLLNRSHLSRMSPTDCLLCGPPPLWAAPSVGCPARNIGPCLID